LEEENEAKWRGKQNGIEAGFEEGGILTKKTETLNTSIKT